MFSSCFSLPSEFKITNTFPAALQPRLVTRHSSPGLWWRARAALCFARRWSPHHLRAHLSLPNPRAAFFLAVLCFFCQLVWPSCGWWVTHSALVLLCYFPYCSWCASWPLIRVLVYGFLLFIVFSTLRCLLFLLPLCSLCSCYTLCSAVPYSHGIALFHVPNDCSSLFEKCLWKTHCPYIKEWNKDELAWLGEPGKYASSSDESGLSWALILWNS